MVRPRDPRPPWEYACAPSLYENPDVPLIHSQWQSGHKYCEHCSACNPNPPEGPPPKVSWSEYCTENGLNHEEHFGKWGACGACKARRPGGKLTAPGQAGPPGAPVGQQADLARQSLEPDSMPSGAAARPAHIVPGVRDRFDHILQYANNVRLHGAKTVREQAQVLQGTNAGSVPVSYRQQLSTPHTNVQPPHLKAANDKRRAEAKVPKEKHFQVYIVLCFRWIHIEWTGPDNETEDLMFDSLETHDDTLQFISDSEFNTALSMTFTYYQALLDWTLAHTPEHWGIREPPYSMPGHGPDYIQCTLGGRPKLTQSKDVVTITNENLVNRDVEGMLSVFPGQTKAKIPVIKVVIDRYTPESLKEKDAKSAITGAARLAASNRRKEKASEGAVSGIDEDDIEGPPQRASQDGDGDEDTLFFGQEEDLLTPRRIKAEKITPNKTPRMDYADLTGITPTKDLNLTPTKSLNKSPTKSPAKTPTKSPTPARPRSKTPDLIDTEEAARERAAADQVALAEAARKRSAAAAAADELTDNEGINDDEPPVTSDVGEGAAEPGPPSKRARDRSSKRPKTGSAVRGSDGKFLPRQKLKDAMRA